MHSSKTDPRYFKAIPRKTNSSCGTLSPRHSQKMAHCPLTFFFYVGVVSGPGGPLDGGLFLIEGTEGFH